MPSHKYSLITLLLSLMLAAFAQNLSQVQNVFTSPNNYPAWNVAYSPDGSLLAVALWDEAHSIKILEADSGREVASLVGHTDDVNSVAFSPDGSFLASGSDDNTVKIWRTADFSLVHSLVGHTALIWSVAFSPAGDFLASGSADKTVKIWRTADFSLVASLEEHTSWVRSVAFSPAGDFLASGSHDNTVKIWRTADFSLVHSLEEHTSWVRSVAFSPAGDFLASGSYDTTVKIWRTADFSLVHSLEEHTGSIYSVAFSPAGDFLASGSRDNTVKIWHVNDSYSLHKTITGVNGSGYWIPSVAFHPAGTSLAVANMSKSWDEGVVSLWGTASRQAVFCPAGCGAVQYVDVTIYSTAGARVVLDGRVLAESSTGVFTTQLEAGAYQVQASKDGYRSASGTLEAQLNGANQLALILQEYPPELASLTIRSTAGASVTVDGQALPESSVGFFTGRFGVGSYRVNISKAGYQSRSERVDVAANRSNDFSFPLSEDGPPPPPPPPIAPRKALIIANTIYQQEDVSLSNPANDANALALTLRGLGFTVQLHHDLGFRDMVSALKSFEAGLQQGDVALFFYAGHGASVGGENYLIPTDIDLENDYIDHVSLSLEDVLDSFDKGGAKLSILIVDACRTILRGGGTFTTVSENALESYNRNFTVSPNNPYDVQGVFIAFSTSPGALASDGSGSDHSPYASQLLRHLATPNMQIEEVFKTIRQDVFFSTNQKQRPWDNDNLIGNFYFVPPTP